MSQPPNGYRIKTWNGKGPGAVDGGNARVGKAAMEEPIFEKVTTMAAVHSKVLTSSK